MRKKLFCFFIGFPYSKYLNLDQIISSLIVKFEDVKLKYYLKYTLGALEQQSC